MTHERRTSVHSMIQRTQVHARILAMVAAADQKIAADLARLARATGEKKPSGGYRHPKPKDVDDREFTLHVGDTR